MPNGVSCAYFAIRNHIYGQKEKNIFKKGIASAQTARTIDTVAKTGVLKGPVATSVTSFFDKAAAFARKIVYPLIIGSGIYNTVKSDDKVKTGVTQASAIATMYTFEQVAERGLNVIDKKIMNSNFFASNKKANFAVKALWYIAKGAGFVAASMAGYNVGSKGGSSVVDKIRDIKSKKDVYLNFPLEGDLKEDQVEATLFDEIKLQ